MLCSDIFRTVSGMLDDEQVNRRWPWSSGDGSWSLIDAMNAAVREIVMQRPDATAESRVITLDANTMRQPLPADATAMIDIVANVSGEENTLGRPVFKVEMDAMRASLSWASETTDSRIQKWAYPKLDNRNEFWVFPTPTVPLNVLVTISKRPPTVSAPSDVFPLADEYANAAAYFILADCMLGDHGESNPSKGSLYMAMFANTLGIKLSADIQFPVSKGGANAARA